MKILAGLLFTILIVIVMIFIGYYNYEKGFLEGRENERSRWMNEAHSAPYLHQVPGGGFYSVKHYRGEE